MNRKQIITYREYVKENQRCKENGELHIGNMLKKTNDAKKTENYIQQHLKEN